MLRSITLQESLSKMFRLLSQSFKEVSVLRRLIFALVHLPEDLPNLWEVAIGFSTGKNQSSISNSEIRVLMENLKEIDAAVFCTDDKLLQELMKYSTGTSSKPMGLVFLSSIQSCPCCSKPLLIRKDRPSMLVVYDDTLGSVPGTHYHRYCTRRECGYKQYYGYHTKGGSSEVFYDPDWESLPYFVSSRETAFSRHLLCRINGEVLIGQLSFKQCADLYNHLHQYCTLKSEISR